MLPIIDYDNIAIVVSKVAAVGGKVKIDNKYGFKVFLDGKEEPVIAGYFKEDEVDDVRSQLIEQIAHYYFFKEFGPDFEIGDLVEYSDDDDTDDDPDFDDTTNFDKNKNEH